ncbi:unnamed protein product, partial [Iphiclides podalirius]
MMSLTDPRSCLQGVAVSPCAWGKHVVFAGSETITMAEMLGAETIDCFEYDIKVPEIVTTDEMAESGYQEGSETSFGDAKEGFGGEGFGGEGDSDSGVDGVSSGCSTVDDCPVVSINDVVAYYDVRPRRRHVPQLNFYHVDIERMAMDAVVQLPPQGASGQRVALDNVLKQSDSGISDAQRERRAAFCNLPCACVTFALITFAYGSEPRRAVSRIDCAVTP